MITTVTLNAAIDKTYYLPRFETNQVSRVQKMFAYPGGKGINVARVIHQLGEKVWITGLVGGKNGEFIETQLTLQGIQHEFVHVQGESRLCLNIIDEENQTSTELLEPGPTISTKEIEHFENLISIASKKSEIVIFSGSLPQGIPSNIYARFIRIAKNNGAKVFLDTSGDALLHGIEYAPHFIKPNEDEIKQITNFQNPLSTDSITKSMKELMKTIECVVVSLGAQGSVAGYKGEIYRSIPPKINVVNTVGSGDAFVAGMAVSCLQGKNFEETLRFATAIGTANALTKEAGNINGVNVNKLITEVEIVKM